jgi:hypothetical protein
MTVESGIPLGVGRVLKTVVVVGEMLSMIVLVIVWVGIWKVEMSARGVIVFSGGISVGKDGVKIVVGSQALDSGRLRRAVARTTRREVISFITLCFVKFFWMWMCWVSARFWVEGAGVAFVFCLHQ